MLAWRALIPISLVQVLLTAIVVFLFHGESYTGLNAKMALALLFGNIVAAISIMLVSRMLPPAPLTNRKLNVMGSRYGHTPLPAGYN
jgi:hypothetical protein